MCYLYFACGNAYLTCAEAEQDQAIKRAQDAQQHHRSDAQTKDRIIDALRAKLADVEAARAGKGQTNTPDLAQQIEALQAELASKSTSLLQLEQQHSDCADLRAQLVIHAKTIEDLKALRLQPDHVEVDSVCVELHHHFIQPRISNADE